MKLISTRGGARPANLRSAVFQGLADDGGLYLPETVPPLSRDELGDLVGANLAEIGSRIAIHLFGDELDDGTIRELIGDALNFPIPLVALEDGNRVLELFHGPTGSFKDVGARFLAGLVRIFRAAMKRDVVVLVATSGDTGGAVAHAFHREPGVRTIVLFPEGKVSTVQRRQLTEVGGNVEPVAVHGTFDDCQRLVKRGIADPELREDALFTSANSISVGRLLPQSFYYFHAWSQLGGPADPAGAPFFSVPCGNLGNLTGGALAHRMGLPVSGFLAATNVNDTMVRFLATGRLEPARAVQTLSSAMDVAEPNNLERLLHLYGNDAGALAADVSGTAHTDEETLAAIRRVHEEQGYLMDPHTAVGWLALREAVRAGSKESDAPGIVLATASPAKFPETVLRATGVEPDWRSMIPHGARGARGGGGDAGAGAAGGDSASDHDAMDARGSDRPRTTDIPPLYEELLPILRSVPTGAR